MTGLPAARWSPRDRGAALVLVMIWGFGMLLLALVASQTVVNLVRPSDQAEQSFRAWTAAEAGVDDFRARVAAAQNGDITAAITGGTNPAIGSWIPIPGGESGDAVFTYTLDTSRAFSAGSIIIRSTGYAGGQYRTVIAELAKQTMFDYAYASNYETVAPEYPDYFSGTSGQISRTNAYAWCADRYWAESGPTKSQPNWTQANGPNHRDSEACIGGLLTNWAIGKNDRFLGNVHTNDVFVLYTANADSPLSIGQNAFDPSTVFTQNSTSSCPEPTAVNRGCLANHRWLASHRIGTTSEAGGAAITWNPDAKTEIEIRNEGMAALKARAREAGCLLTGPTRLRFHADGTVVITSPDSKEPNPTTPGSIVNCGGTALQATVATASTPRPYTATPASLSSAFNGVIYVQDVPASGDPNSWPSGAPSCADKNASTNGVQPFPYVPTATSGSPHPENEGFPAGDTLTGFPEKTANLSGQVETFSTDQTSNKYSQACTRGTVYIEGSYTGAFTVVSEYDIAITSDLIDSSVPASLRPNRTGSVSASNTHPEGWGRPDPASENLMGLVPSRMLYVYGCGSNVGCTTYNRETRTTNLVINMASVAVNGCLTVMDGTLTSSFGRLSVIGSLGQKYRCPISKPTGNSGFSLWVEYDNRFTTLRPPPFLAELSQEPWRIQSMQEGRTVVAALPTLPSA